MSIFLEGLAAMGSSESLRSFLSSTCEWKDQDVDLSCHYYELAKEQLMAILPITILLMAWMYVFFQEGMPPSTEMIFGLSCAVVGLVFFVDALRVTIMPLSDQLGVELPQVLPLPAILLVAFILGVTVTYAEPAIASLAPLANKVDPERAAYLYCALKENTQTTVLMVGIGVGLAAILGTLRFVKDWPLLPLIFSTLLPTMGLSCYMWWGDPRLRPVLGFAWDCGGVTTGPVTVPVLLALGIGVMKTVNAQKAAEAALSSDAPAEKKENALEGFGIVTLASIFPIMMVQCYGTYLSFTQDEDDIIARGKAARCQMSPIAARGCGVEYIEPELGFFDVTPGAQIYGATRAVAPLFLILLFLVKVVLGKPLPYFTFFVKSTKPSEDSRKLKRQKTSLKTYIPITVMMMRHHGLAGSTVGQSAPAHVGDETGFGSNVVMIAGMFEGIVGMFLFNVGLTLGFSSLGGNVGSLIPASYMDLSENPELCDTALLPEYCTRSPHHHADDPTCKQPDYCTESPYFPRTSGIFIAFLVLFLLGFLATRAEPGLNVLGGIVQHLSKGSFSKNMLVYAVSFGVAIGMGVGVSKILFGVPLIIILLIMYFIALSLSAASTEDLRCIAWDSAGVTTGPVTVPFVLYIGVGCSLASSASEGFGILACASVFPICSVLAMDLLNRTREQTAAIKVQAVLRGRQAREKEKHARELEMH
jgi:hypothetical protein